MQIKLENISYFYGLDLALDDISFVYDKSDILALIGPNGGGKSTLLKLILGLLEPKCGTLNVSAKLGYVPQFIPINTSFSPTLKEVVLMGRLNRSFFYSKDDEKIALESLEKVGLAPFASQKISSLSGGQRQRAYIARALACRAEILLLDEPTASLDPRSSAQIYELLLNLNKSGIGIIIASHDTAMLRFFASKIAFVNKRIYMHQNERHEVDFNALLSSEHFCEVEIASMACACDTHS